MFCSILFRKSLRLEILIGIEMIHKNNHQMSMFYCFTISSSPLKRIYQILYLGLSYSNK